MLNHLHVWNFFHPEDEAEERALEVLAQRISETWKCHVETEFPGRIANTIVNHDYGPTIIMYSEDPSTAAD